eukprot:6208236-Pleurochrysis_carterae.AAC.2
MHRSVVFTDSQGWQPLSQLMQDPDPYLACCFRHEIQVEFSLNPLARIAPARRRCSLRSTSSRRL